MRDKSKKDFLGKNFVTAVILAAGSGKRAGSKTPKQFVKIAGKRIFEYSLEAFINSKLVNEIIFVVPVTFLKKIKIKNKKVKIISGGRRRQDSAVNALKNISGQSDVVLVHDAARPFVSGNLISSCIKAAMQNGGAIATSVLSDTIKTGAGGFVRETLDREKLFRAQTPQAFRSRYVEKMIGLLSGKKVYTDEAAALEVLKVKVKLVLNGGENLKITTASDVKRAEVILSLDRNKRRI